MPLCERDLAYIFWGQSVSDPETKEEAEVIVKQAAHFSHMKGFRNAQQRADSVKRQEQIKRLFFL